MKLRHYFGGSAVVAIAVSAAFGIWCGCGGNGGNGGGPEHDTWAPVSSTGAPSSLARGVWTGSKLFVWNGDEGGLYDPSNDSWTSISTAGAPVGQYGFTLVWTGSKVVLWGGWTGTGPTPTYPTGGAAYDLVSDTWTPTTETNAPAGRELHTAVWTGSKMIVWGGAYDDGLGKVRLDTGGVYDPAADSWTATATLGAPSARSEQGAVWTGSEMIVWGGVEASTWPCTTGGRYDPGSDIWAPIATPAILEARTDYSAAWTGSKMLIWGGFFYDGTGHLLNTGALYDPGADAWTAMSLAGAPSGRMRHSTVWTGSQMIVWGGDDTLDAVTPDAIDDTNTGGVYDPAGDSWTATSTAGAPCERNGHVAVWTGSTMIVWGGIDRIDAGSSTGLKDGGIYTP